MTSETVLGVRKLTKVFPSPAGDVVVLDAIDFEVRRGERVAVTGPSGVGKSTLLYCLAGLDQPSAGEIFHDGRPLASLDADQLAAHRNRFLGFVWQLSNLLPDFTAQENVMLPLLARGESHTDAARAADRWLTEVGLAARAGHLAGELSGGEAQRTALARALVTGPQVLFADEPTGSLDAATSAELFALLERLHTAHNLTSVLATHNLALVARCDRVWRLEKGQLSQNSRPPG